LVEFSARARGYTLLTLAFLILLLLIPEERDDTRRAGVAALVLALGARTAPVMLYPVVACMAIVLLRGSEAPRRWLVAVFLFGGAFTFTLYVPVLVVSGPASIVANGN